MVWADRSNANMSWKLKERQQKWLAQEKGTVFKDWGGKLHIALAFPNRYTVGMSNLGFQAVYGLLNGHTQVVCERVFYPEADDLRELEYSPGQLLSVESQRPIRDFHLLAFSIPFENDYTNAVAMLTLAGIPPHHGARTHGHPLVAAGGVAVCLNPEPLARFMDFFLIGEAEALVPDFLEALLSLSGSPGSHRQAIVTLATQVPGIYAPSLYQVAYAVDGVVESMQPLPISGLPTRVEYRRADFSEALPCRSIIWTPNTEFSSATLVEIGRGCGRGCRFCAAGFVYRPARCHSAERLLAAVASTLPESNRVGLVSAAVSDHPQAAMLCETLTGLGASLSFSSLRADTIVPQIAAALQASHHRAVAIAPEAGSDRLRRVINKNLNAEQIYAAVEKLTEVGILNLKLYFMIGLPTESPDDLEAIVELAKGIKHHVLKISRGTRRLGTITLSIHSFVPKPCTPFQWVAFVETQELKKRAKWIQKALRKVANVRVHFDLPKWAYVQAVLARGDRRTGALIEKVAIDGLSWMQAMRESSFNPDFWSMRERRRDELFPWEIIDHGIKRSYLWDEYQKACVGETSPPCPPTEECRRCGVCRDGPQAPPSRD